MGTRLARRLRLENALLRRVRDSRLEHALLRLARHLPLEHALLRRLLVEQPRLGPLELRPVEGPHGTLEVGCRQRSRGNGLRVGERAAPARQPAQQAARLRRRGLRGRFGRWRLVDEGALVPQIGCGSATATTGTAVCAQLPATPHAQSLAPPAPAD